MHDQEHNSPEPATPSACPASPSSDLTRRNFLALLALGASVTAGGKLLLSASGPALADTKVAPSASPTASLTTPATPPNPGNISVPPPPPPLEQNRPNPAGGVAPCRTPPLPSPSPSTPPPEQLRVGPPGMVPPPPPSPSPSPRLRTPSPQPSATPGKTGLMPVRPAPGENSHMRLSGDVATPPKPPEALQPPAPPKQP